MEDPTPHTSRPGTLSLRNSLAPIEMRVLFDSQLLYSHNYTTSFKKITRTTISLNSGVNARGTHLSQKISGLSSVSSSNNQTAQPRFNLLGFWPITLIRWVDGFQRFDETCHVHLQGFKVQGPLKPLTMKEAGSFEVRNNPPTQHHILEDRNPRFATVETA
jgi:hypothetical protein